MKKFAIASLLTLAPFTNAQANTCLENLQGHFFYVSKNVPDHVFSIEFVNNAWQFKQPDNPSADKEKLFKYSFKRSNTLPAKPIIDDHLSYLGSALLAPYIDKPDQLKGVDVKCGLITDDFYMLYIDLSKANLQLIKNMVMMEKAQEGKNYEVEPSTKEIEDMRKQTYFSGLPFELQSVTSGVLGFILKKQTHIPSNE